MPIVSIDACFSGLHQTPSVLQQNVWLNQPPVPPPITTFWEFRPTASPQQIRRAFRDLSKLYHPDTTELPPAEATEKISTAE